MSESNNVPRVQKQYLRHCSVTIKNFKKEVKTVIGNDFEIEFEYFKTVDQTQEDDSGKVTIYGLSDETIALLEEEGGEIWLDCGYVYAEIDTLFIAHISRVYTEVSNNITATTIECSANLLTHFFSGFAVSDSLTPLPLYDLLENLATAIGFPQMVFDGDNIPKEHQESVAKFVSTVKTTSYNIGNINTVLEGVTDYYGLRFGRILYDQKDSAAFSFTEIGLKRVLKAIQTGYPSIDITSPEIVSRKNIFYNTLSENENNREGFVLTKDTGLISQQAEYQLVTAFLDQELGRNEFETAESFYNRANPKEKKKKSKGSSENFVSSYGDSGDGYVSNSTLEGLVIKGGVGGQATGGGKVKGYTSDFSRIVSNLLGADLIRFTGFNDYYHAGSSSKHASGQAFDLTIKSSYAGAPNQKKRILEAARQNGYRVTVLDEYNFPSDGATAPHLHISVHGRDGSGQTDSPTEDIESEEKSKGLFEESQEELYGRVPIEINRRYNKIVALLNPAIKPQSLVFTKHKYTNDLITHRVRHATYSGNNKKGDWLMTLFCEDTESKSVVGYKVDSTPISTELAPEVIE